MKILIITHEYPPVGGGGGNAARKLAQYLTSNGWQVFVLTSKFGRQPDEENDNNISIFRIANGRKSASGSTPIEWIRFALKGIFRSKYFIQKISPDLCIAFFILPAGLIAAYIKFRFKIKYIVSLRGADVPGFLKGKLSLIHFLLRPIIAYVLKASTYAVGNSKWLVNLAAKTVRDLEFKVINNGFDYSAFHFENRIFSEKRINLLFVGRLDNQKGILYLLHAVKLLNFDYSLTIVGDGKLRAAIDKFISENNLASKVRLTGWIDRKNLKKFYDAADIFILPSLDEGMPQALMEAMASGLPVVASRAGGVPEVLEDKINGILINPADVSEISNAISLMAGDPNLRKTFSNANIIKSRSFTWDNTGQNYMELLQGIL